MQLVVCINFCLSPGPQSMPALLMLQRPAEAAEVTPAAGMAAAECRAAGEAGVAGPGAAAGLRVARDDRRAMSFTRQMLSRKSLG